MAVAARTGRPQLVPVMTAGHFDEVSLSPGHLEHMRRLRYASGIAVPLVARGRTLGVFAFVRRQGRVPYDEQDLRLAIELARRASAALDNARLFAELSATERQLEAVLGNLAEAVTVQAPDHGLIYVNQAAARLLECASPDEVLATPMPEILDRFVALDEEGRPMDLGRLPGREALAGRAPDPVLMRSISTGSGACPASAARPGSRPRSIGRPSSSSATKRSRISGIGVARTSSGDAHSSSRAAAWLT